MPSIKSLKVKIELAALVPAALVLVVVAIVGLYAYDRASRDLVLQRDAELARVSAARLSEDLNWYTYTLQRVANNEEVQSMEVNRLHRALHKAQNQLYVFDAGVVVCNSKGLILWSQPFTVEREGMNFSTIPEFDKVRWTKQPAFSNMFKDTVSGSKVILIGVPILGSYGEYKGMLAGMVKMKYPLLGAIYAEVLKIKVGRTGYAYLVDGNGQVIYHPDGSQIGRNLKGTAPVMQAIRGEIGAVLTEGLEGERVVSGFASVPGTGWGLITQERWQTVVGPVRDYSKLLLCLLVAGGIISGALVFFIIGRTVKPIKDLTRGTRRVAEGDFDYAVIAKTGDEIQALAEQFNAMTSALKASYTKVKESEERYRAIFEATGTATVIMEEDTTIALANTEFEKLSGYSKQEIEGLSLIHI